MYPISTESPELYRRRNKNENILVSFTDTVYLRFVHRVIKFNMSRRLIYTLAIVVLVHNEYLTAQHRHDHAVWLFFTALITVKQPVIHCANRSVFAGRACLKLSQRTKLRAGGGVREGGAA